MPGLILDCETPGGCEIPEASKEIKKAFMVRQDLFRLKVMGWPETYKEKYIKQEYDPDLHIMQLAMMADQIIADKQRAKQEASSAKENRRT